MQHIVKIINKILAHSTYYQANSADFAAKAINLEVIDTINLSVEFGAETKIYLNLHPNADLTLRGSKQDFIKLVLNQDYQQLKNYKIEIQGDVELAQQMMQLMQNLNLDWQTLLTESIGLEAATIAVEASNLLRQGFKRAFKYTNNALKEYIVYEQALVATKTEIGEFCDKVDKLRLSTDFVEIRAAKLGIKL